MSFPRRWTSLISGPIGQSSLTGTDFILALLCLAREVPSGRNELIDPPRGAHPDGHAASCSMRVICAGHLFQFRAIESKRKKIVIQKPGFTPLVKHPVIVE
jgi:hypothetical protein